MGKPVTMPPTDPRIVHAFCGAETWLVVYLADGRRLEVPWAWYPLLRDATKQQRADFRLLGEGVGIHWPQVDEDLSLRGMLCPHPEERPFVGEDSDGGVDDGEATGNPVNVRKKCRWCGGTFVTASTSLGRCVHCGKLQLVSAPDADGEDES